MIYKVYLKVMISKPIERKYYSTATYLVMLLYKIDFIYLFISSVPRSGNDHGILLA